MGWERKRGKLAEFNRFLPRRRARGFSSRSSATSSALRGVRYVITLDADTVLPPDAAPLLIGALAHPLNRAVFDPVRGRVVRGYGILQPRVGVALPSAHRSRFAAIHSGHPGVDPVHHGRVRRLPGSVRRGELHRQGDLRCRRVRAGDPRPLPREHAAVARPDRGQLRPRRARHRHRGLRRLSRPATSRFTRRKHRWIRGDWQLLPWLTRAGAGPRRPRAQPALAALALEDPRQPAAQHGRAGAAASSCVAGWTVLPATPLRWTLLGLGAMAAPWTSSLCCWRCCGRRWTSRWRAYYAAVGRDAATSMQQLALAIAFLPHQAWVSVDAIVRTLWRLVRHPPAAARVADRLADRAHGRRRRPAPSGARCGPRWRSRVVLARGVGRVAR